MFDFFKKLFGGNNRKTEQPQNKADNIIETIEMKSVDDMLVLLKKDHYNDGYVTALKVPDKKMGEISLAAIKAKYLSYIQQIENHYVEERKKTEKIKTLNEGNGMHDLVKENDKILETIDNEMSVLAQIREDVLNETENGYFQLVIQTFWRGFYAGIYDVMQGKLISGSLDPSRKENND